MSYDPSDDQWQDPYDDDRDDRDDDDRYGWLDEVIGGVHYEADGSGWVWDIYKNEWLMVEAPRARTEPPR